jgi:hypothetical protein
MEEDLAIAGGGAADKFTVVLETAGLNATVLSVYCRERGLYPEQVCRWRQAAHNAKPVRTMAEQKELEKLHAQDQREIKALKKELQRKRSVSGSSTPAISRCTPRCRLGRLCQRWPIRASTTPSEKTASTAQNPVATVSWTRRGSANGGVGHVLR